MTHVIALCRIGLGGATPIYSLPLEQCDRGANSSPIAMTLFRVCTAIKFQLNLTAT